MVDALFTYGTLMPGHLRWAMLEPQASRWEEATAPGLLYDTGNGWPAARFLDPADGLDAADHAVVPGWVVHFAGGRLAGLLPALDAMEGIGGVGRDPYVRRVIETTAGQAWAYDATDLPASWAEIDRWSDQPEA